MPGTIMPSALFAYRACSQPKSYVPVFHVDKPSPHRLISFFFFFLVLPSQKCPPSTVYSVVESYQKKAEAVSALRASVVPSLAQAAESFEGMSYAELSKLIASLLQRREIMREVSWDVCVWTRMRFFGSWLAFLALPKCLSSFIFLNLQ